MHAAAKLARRGSQYFSGSGSSGDALHASQEAGADGAGGLPAGEPGTPQPPDEAATTMTPEESLRSYELFEALRSFEPGTSEVDKLLQVIERAPSSKSNTAVRHRPTCAIPSPLHTAVRCAKTGTVDVVLRQRPQDLNARDPEGQSPLHIAAALGRSDVVKLLLSQADIDDTVKDVNRRTPLDVARSHELAKLMQVSRAQVNETYQSLLQAYIATGPTNGAATPRSSHHSLLPEHGRHSSITDTSSVHSLDTHAAAGQGGSADSAREAMVSFLKKPRSKGVHFSMLTPGSRGSTLVHEAARRKDVEMLKLCAARGASMVVRDRKGKMPMDVAKDEQVRQLLRQGVNSEGRALKSSVAMGVTSPSMANLSLTPSASSGGQSISHHQQPSMKGYLSKWTNMTRGYRTRYFVLHNGHISYYRDAEEEGQTSRGTIGMSVANVEFSSTGYTGTSTSSTEKSTFTISTSLGKSPRWFLKANHPVEAMQWVNALRSAIELSKKSSREGEPSGGLGLGLQSQSGGGQVRPRGADTEHGILATPANKPNSLSSSYVGGSGSSAQEASMDEAASLPMLGRTATSGTAQSTYTADTANDSPEMTEGSVYGDDDVQDGYGSLRRVPPHQDNFELLSNSARTQVQYIDQLVAGLSSVDSNDAVKKADLAEAAKRSISLLGVLLDQHLEQVVEREKWYTRRYEREVQTKRMWEENMRSVVSSQADLERELVATQQQSSRRKKALKDLRSSVVGDEGQQGLSSPRTTARDRSATMPRSDQAAVTSPTARTAKNAGEGSASASTLIPVVAATAAPQIDSQLDEELAAVISDSSDDEDDFYDAVESGAVPVRVETPIQSPGHREMPQDWSTDAEKLFEMKSFEGYRTLRDRLPLSHDDRPPVSLWAILKGSIGKDLTKISFPVYFNEPTSMLQRMAEDMEYSECLDAACEESDSLKRIAYVAGFAMSNYASTIGRVAKPFNPMLSETFELANPDKKYRYVSEQVSHHPPISACIAESPGWYYFGEVDAKSKFTGKSFEIRPTGIAHAEVVIPQEWSTGKSKPARRAGHVKEHYSWKKVTTGVSNFIMGNPIIDHYGDMEVTNHATGERCLLSFKPRGWRATNACEIKGAVYDAQNKLRWDLAGRWNGQLVARRAGASSSALDPDEGVPIQPEYFLIWKINQQPPNMPFNLTRFALTLNDAKEDIRKYLPPTDCRLRPDQHAFEEGQFEKANELKSALETFQRSTRSKRERGELPPHKPRWFERQPDEDTGTMYWAPHRTASGDLEYWRERLENYKRIEEGQDAHWKDVEEIFGVRL